MLLSETEAWREGERFEGMRCMLCAEAIAEEVVKVDCSNAECPFGNLMHERCFGRFEENVLKFMRITGETAPPPRAAPARAAHTPPAVCAPPPR